MRQTPPPGLRPNCLLTRYPICFVHGLKNIFCARDYWHGIPEYLKVHGYEIREHFAPWRGPHQARLDAFAEEFRRVLKNYEKIHIIAHSLGTIDMVELLMWPEFKNKFSSVTFVSPPFGGTPFAELGLLFGEKLFASTNQTLTSVHVAEIIKRFSKPRDVLIGTFVSRPEKYPFCPGLRLQHKWLTSYLKARGLNEENDGLVPLDSQLIAKSLGEIFLEFPGDHNQVIGSGPWPLDAKTAHSVYLDHAIFLAEYDFKTAQ
jgi:hypothetical protein